MPHEKGARPLGHFAVNSTLNYGPNLGTDASGASARQHFPLKLRTKVATTSTRRRAKDGGEWLTLEIAKQVSKNGGI